jgi:hypothetical protein
LSVERTLSLFVKIVPIRFSWERMVLLGTVQVAGKDWERVVIWEEKGACGVDARCFLHDISLVSIVISNITMLTLPGSFNYDCKLS